MQKFDLGRKERRKEGRKERKKEGRVNAAKIVNGWGGF